MRIDVSRRRGGTRFVPPFKLPNGTISATFEDAGRYIQPSLLPNSLLGGSSWHCSDRIEFQTKPPCLFYHAAF